MDNILLLSIILVFAGALLGAFIQRRSLDRALKAFGGFFVSMEMLTSKRYWGRLQVFPNGTELVYTRRDGAQGESGKTSDILFTQQLAGIHSIRRYHEELTPQNQRRRRKEVARTFHPSWSRRSLRWLRNMLNTLKDAIGEAMGLIMARAQAGRGAPAPLQGQELRLKAIGSQTLDAAGTAYDPILERYVGRRVYLQLDAATEGEPATEYHGVLQEYSPTWLVLLDCRLMTEQNILLSDTQRLRIQRHLDFHIRLSAAGEFYLRIENRSDHAIDVKRLEADDYQYNIKQTLAPKQNYEVTLTDLPAALWSHIEPSALPLEIALIAPERQTTAVNDATDDDALPLAESVPLPALRLIFESEQEVDLCLPRSRAQLSHGGEYLGSVKRV